MSNESTVLSAAMVGAASEEPTIGSGRVLAASVVGSVIEWYDYALYGTAAALIFGHLFFPNANPTVAMVGTFGTFAAGFVVRPLGGLVAGYYGDRLGRKATLVLTLMTMSLATALIGCLPTYAQAGVWAPVLLLMLRLLQGFAVGGEWGGAVLMAVEFAPPGRRGFWGSFPQIGPSAGIVLGTASFSTVSAFVAPADLLAWGWRIPFIISLVLAGVGMYIRLKVSETPAFRRIHEISRQQSNPVVDVIRQHPKELLLAIFARFADGGNFYLLTVFVLAYAAERAGVPRAQALVCLMIAATLNVLTIPLFGRLSDSLGRRVVFIAGAIFMAAFAWPMFMMVNTGSAAMLALGLSIMMVVGHAPVYSTLASFYAELFPARVRYSGISIGYQSAGIILGGFMPLIASSLIVWTGGNPWPVAVCIAAQALIAAAALFVSPETYKRDLAT
ncbi:MAG TPA: MFS transporter [Pseudolabrys sp.]|jgi:metabolite-proton symporter|nr:MFS transporter [Pseudolabrys sp.]